jgi:hypothetical protein
MDKSNSGLVLAA